MLVLYKSEKWDFHFRRGKFLNMFSFSLSNPSVNWSCHMNIAFSLNQS